MGGVARTRRKGGDEMRHPAAVILSGDARGVAVSFAERRRVAKSKNLSSAAITATRSKQRGILRFAQDDGVKAKTEANSKAKSTEAEAIADPSDFRATDNGALRSG